MKRQVPPRALLQFTVPRCKKPVYSLYNPGAGRMYDNIICYNYLIEIHSMNTDVSKWLEEKGMIFLKEIGIAEGQTVLDYGCNIGHYTIPAAKLVGKRGKVYALDKDAALLNELIASAGKEGLRNIESIISISALNGVMDKVIDVVLLYDILHYMDKPGRKKVYNEIYGILRKGGILSVYPKHNQTDYPLWNLSGVRKEDIAAEIEEEKFQFTGESYKRLLHDNYCNMGYILNFTK